MTRLALVGLLAAMLSWPVLSQTNESPVNRLILSAELSQLSRGNADWTEHALRYVRRAAPRQVTEIAVSRTSRFGLNDTQLELGHTAPLSDRLTATLQASYSPAHRVLPRYSVGGNLQYEFAPAWLAHGGFRRTRYDTTDAERWALMLERYVGDFSASVAWLPVKALGVRSHGVELRGNWYHADGGSLGLIVSRGDEATAFGAGVIALADVRSLALVGRHPLGRGLAISFALNRARQGGSYNRTGVNVGVQRDF